MPSTLSKALGLSPKGQESIEETTGKIKSVADFLSDVVDACKDTDWLTKLSAICPWWLQIMGESATAAAPPIKFIATLFGKLGEIKDPDRLVYLAFTTAYQRAVEKALRATGRPLANVDNPPWKPERDIAIPGDEMSFAAYSLKDPLNHAFIRQADALLNGALKAAGYSDDQCREVHNEVAMRFPGALTALLTHPSTRDKFAAVTDALHFENLERIDAAWRDHFEYQRYQYEDKQVFGEEPFTLSDVYVETECGAY
jgi:hypothetical protein